MPSHADIANDLLANAFPPSRPDAIDGLIHETRISILLTSLRDSLEKLTASHDQARALGREDVAQRIREATWKVAAAISHLESA